MHLIPFGVDLGMIHSYYSPQIVTKKLVTFKLIENKLPQKQWNLPIDL